jgi:Transglycosylase SLT domain.
MLQSKLFLGLVGSLISFGSVTLANARVPQMNSQQLASYANQLNGNAPRVNTSFSYPSASTVTNPVKATSTVSSTKRSGSYTTVSYVNPPVEKQLEIIRPTQTANTNWVQEFAIQGTGNTPDTAHYTNNLSSNVGVNYIRGREANLTCVIAAARSESVPLYVLLGIQSKERGRNGEVNATNDMGHFQVNKQHFKTNGGMFNPQDMERARTDGCYNARLAAKILRDRLSTKVSTYDFWTRAAAYHSWTPSVNARYRPDLIRYSMQWKQWLTQNGINPN